MTLLKERPFFTFHKKIFGRIVFIYSSVAVVAFLTLAVLIYQYYTDSLLQKELAAQVLTVDTISGYLDQKMDMSQDVMLQVYRDKALQEDVLFFLNNDLPDYVRHRLESYFSGSTSNDRDMITFFENQLDRDADISNIALYSSSQSFLYVYQTSLTHFTALPDSQAGIGELINEMRSQKRASSRSPELDKLLGITGEGNYTFALEINDPATLRNVGALLITYKADSLRSVLRSKVGDHKGSQLVLFQDGTILYDSTGENMGKIYPQMGELLRNQGTNTNSLKTYTTIEKTDKSGLYVAALLQEKEMDQSNRGFKSRVISITAICIVVTVLFAYFTVYRYSARTHSIIRAMRHARKGDLSVRIPIRKNDELDEISNSFNLMCQELDSYIKQVYVSEIKQKHAELVAFQAQINPHFLYNALEAIRMKAIAEGAENVGDMTYLLGALLRYTIKQETMVTLEEECENCRRFLELYRIRLKDRITYSIELEPATRSSSLLKLLLQPLVENVIVHGVRSGKKVTAITLTSRIEDDGAAIVICIEDNGKGIKPERLLELQQALSSMVRLSGSSIGLMNVHDRIRLLYGPDYGVSVDSVWNEGTVVKLRIPYQKGGNGLV